VLTIDKGGLIPPLDQLITMPSVSPGGQAMVKTMKVAVVQDFAKPLPIDAGR